MMRGKQKNLRRSAWRLIFIAVGSDMVATIGWSALSANSSMPYGTWVDGLYLIYYPMMTAACLLLFRGEGGLARDLPLWLDAIAFALGLLAMLWLVAFGPQPALRQIPTASIFTAGAYGLGNALTMATAAALVMQIGDWRSQKSTLLLLLSMVRTLATDTAWITLQLHGVDTESTLLNMGYDTRSRSCPAGLARTHDHCGRYRGHRAADSRAE